MFKQVKKTIYTFFCWLLLLPACSLAQTRRIDSLKRRVQLLSSKADILDALLGICKMQSGYNPDTLYHYAVSARALAVLQKDAEKTVLADYYIGTQYLNRGLTDSSLAIAERYLTKLRYAGPEKELYVNFTLLQAKAYNNINKAKEALNLLYPLLTKADKEEDSLAQVRIMNSLAAVFVSTGDDKQAQQWCYKALQLFPRPIPAAFQEIYGITLNNTSLTFMHFYSASGEKKLLDSAEYYTSRAVQVNSENELLGSLAYTLGLKGTILGMNHKPAEGERLLKESLATYRQIGNNYYIINTMAVMGNFYGITGQPKKGIEICKEGIEFSKTSPRNIYLYQNLAGNYKLAGDYKHYGETMEIVTAIKDSLHQKNSAEALSEVQTRYEIQKKENTIIQQNYALAKKNYLAYGSLVLLLTGGLFVFILFRLNRKRQAFRFEAMQKEEQTLKEIAINSVQEKERRNIAAELHDNLGGQLSYISSNMDFILEAPAILTDDEKKEHLNKINATAKSTIADLRESIWALKKQSVEIDELADKIKLYAQSRLVQQNAVHLEIKEHILQKTFLSSVAALNIFRICQEAIDNAVKHSGADKISISIETSANGGYCMAVSDNGKGFNTSGYVNEHNGLENMRQRAREVQAVLRITSTIDNGTLVQLLSDGPNSPVSRTT